MEQTSTPNEKDFKKAFGHKNGKKAYIIFMVILIISNIITPLIVHKNDEIQIQTSINLSNASPSTQGTEISNNPNPINFSNDTQNWNYTGYTIDNSEVCPTVFKNYYPIIWYKLPVAMIFKAFSFTYIYPTNNNSPAYVIAIGKDVELLKLYLHEQSPQLIGASINQLDQNNVPKFDRTNPLTLNEVPLPESEITITINPVKAGNNGITYNFNIIYTPKSRPKDKMDDPFTLTSMYFGDTSQAQTEIGYGTSVNNCITPMRYTLY